MDYTKKNYYCYYYFFKPISDLIVNRYLEISPSIRISMYYQAQLTTVSLFPKIYFEIKGLIICAPYNDTTRLLLLLNTDGRISERNVK